MNKESAHKRFLQAIDYLKDKGKARTHEEIAEFSNTSRSNVSSAISGNPRYLTEPFLRRFASAYSDYINEDWLIDGVGEMAKPGRELRPHFGAKASAGFLDGLSEGESEENMKSLYSFLPDYDFTIEVQGDSMLPDYHDGDILACRFSSDSLNPPVGRVCVIDSKDGAAVKEVRAVNDGSITLHSFNPRYRDYEVEFGNINQIALVVGSIRMEE